MMISITESNAHMYEGLIYFDTNSEDEPIRRSLIIALLEPLPHCGFIESASEGYEASNLKHGPIVYYCNHEATAIHISEYVKSSCKIDLKIIIQEIKDQSWQQSWNQDHEFLSTDKFMIAESELHTPLVQPMKHHLIIEDGGVFGRGDHATTEACLKTLENISPIPGDLCLDVGTGTGILALAARKLGYQCVGTDIDAQCLITAERNGRLNSLDVAWVLGELPKSDLRQFQLIMCNILIPELYEVLPTLVQRLRPGGKLLLAGFPEHRNSEVTSKIKTYDLSQETCVTVRGWSCLAFS